MKYYYIHFKKWENQGLEKLSNYQSHKSHFGFEFICSNSNTYALCTQPPSFHEKMIQDHMTITWAASLWKNITLHETGLNATGKRTLEGRCPLVFHRAGKGHIILNKRYCWWKLQKATLWPNLNEGSSFWLSDSQSFSPWVPPPNYQLFAFFFFKYNFQLLLHKLWLIKTGNVTCKLMTCCLIKIIPFLLI